jgi:tetratricopeptide (TPR) repeat protein
MRQLSVDQLGGSRATAVTSDIHAARLTLADFNRAIELNPGYAWAIARRGDTYRLMERYDEALADLNRALELNPGREWAIASRGHTYLEMKRYDEALADLNRAIELNPGNASALAGRGATYRVMKRYDEALADLNRAVDLNPGNAWAAVPPSRAVPGRRRRRCRGGGPAASRGPRPLRRGNRPPPHRPPRPFRESRCCAACVPTAEPGPAGRSRRRPLPQDDGPG